MKEGEVIRRVSLSRTLATIAEDGPDVFYKVEMILFRVVGP